MLDTSEAPHIPLSPHSKPRASCYGFPPFTEKTWSKVVQVLSLVPAEALTT